jgi:hypothetical protein
MKAMLSSDLFSSLTAYEAVNHSKGLDYLTQCFSLYLLADRDE